MQVLHQSEPPAGKQDSALRKHNEKQNGAIKLAVKQPTLIDSRSVAAQFKHLWSLHHLVPKSNGVYDSYTIEVCGDGPLAILRCHLMEFNTQELWDMYAQTDSRMGTLRGVRYEAYVHKQILTHGLKATACKLGIARPVPGNLLQLSISVNASPLYLRNNDVTGQLVTEIQNASTNGVYLMPRLLNFPVLDSIYVPRSSESSLKVGFQMKAGNSKLLSADKATSIVATVGSSMVVILPHDCVLTKRSPGRTALEQFLRILNEGDEDKSDGDHQMEEQEETVVGDVSRVCVSNGSAFPPRPFALTVLLAFALCMCFLCFLNKVEQCGIFVCERMAKSTTGASMETRMAFHQMST